MTTLTTKPQSVNTPEVGALGVMTIEQVATALGLSKSHIYALTSKREIPHYKPRGGRIFFDVLEIREWLSQGRIKTNREIAEQAEAHSKAKEAERKAKRSGVSH